jgi:hypothetical protein
MILNFPTGEGNFINYNWSDLATGTGYKTFWCGTAIEVGTEVYNLIPEALQTFSKYTTAVNTAIEINFNLLFNTPTRLRGTAHINIPLAIRNVDSNPHNGTMACTLKLYKVASGGAETQIGSTVSKTFTWSMAAAISVPGNDYDWNYWNFVGDVVMPLTLFKPDEKLRLEITAAAPGEAHQSVYIFHDPTNYGLSSDPSLYDDTGIYKIASFKSLINIPFKIAL